MVAKPIRTHRHIQEKGSTSLNSNHVGVNKMGPCSTNSRHHSKNFADANL